MRTSQAMQGISQMEQVLPFIEALMLAGISVIVMTSAAAMAARLTGVRNPIAVTAFQPQEAPSDHLGR